MVQRSWFCLQTSTSICNTHYTSQMYCCNKTVEEESEGTKSCPQLVLYLLKKLTPILNSYKLDSNTKSNLINSILLIMFSLSNIFLRSKSKLRHFNSTKLWRKQSGSWTKEIHLMLWNLVSIKWGYQRPMIVNQFLNSSNHLFNQQLWPLFKDKQTLAYQKKPKLYSLN